MNPAIFRMFWQVYANDHMALSKHPHFSTVVDSTFPYVQKLDLESMVSYFALMPQMDITPDLSKIDVPTSVIVGDRDPIVPARQSLIIAEKVANSNLAVIKGSGHLPFFEKPIEYEKAVGTWLAEFQSLS